MSGSDKPVLHLVSNAHLDPIWQWQWEEGAVEALSTFRTAEKLLRMFPEYVFVHNESVLYEWVEEHDPELFESIRELVKAGRWVIVGGWYLQPDCNVPGGESFVRQIMVGKRFFREKFGVETNIGYNVDSFGHNGGLPQILSKSGYDYYTHFRPVPGQLEISEDAYIWRGVDGSEVLACRSTLGFYCTEAGGARERALAGVEKARSQGHDAVAFWGVGDHGGGASIEELTHLRELLESVDDVEIRHSHPAAFCEAMNKRRESLPVMEGDLQRCFTGCYTSAAHIKRGHRMAEGLIAQAERFSALADYYNVIRYPCEELDSAWKDLLFNEFHDIIAGTSSVAGTQDGMEIFGRCKQNARKVRLCAALAIAKLDPPEEEGIPVYVYNPHSFTYKGAVEADFMIDYRPSWNEHIDVEVVDRSGNVIASQEEMPTAVMPFDWRKKLVFEAEVPPLTHARYMVKRTEPKDAGRGVTVDESRDSVTIDTRRLRADFSRESGLMTSLVDQRNGFNLLKGAGFELLVVNDIADSWGADVVSYREVVGRFRAADAETVAKVSGCYEIDSEPSAIRVVENGPVRTVLESVLAFGGSTVVQRFYFYPDKPCIEVKLRVNWNEPKRMLKLAVPTVLNDAVVKCEIPYGAIERAADGTEHTCQRWIMLESGDKAVGLVNTGQYGFDAQDGELRLSLLRSAAFCMEQSVKLGYDRSYEFMDLGVHEISVALVVGDRDAVLADTIIAANQMNIPALSLPYFPVGPGDLPNDGQRLIPEPFAAVTPETVVLGALKKAEDGRGYIVRLHESAGKATEAELSLGGRQSMSLSFGGYEIKSMRIVPEGDMFQVDEVDLLER